MTGPDYDAGYEAGALAAAGHIIGYLNRTGQGVAANAVLAAWNTNTLVEHPAPAPKDAGTEPGPAPINRDIARAQGFTGNQCANCNSMQMKVSGHCEVCSDCGTTTGCS